MTAAIAKGAPLGFIGLGVMGAAMTSRMPETGFPL
jgi:3-hydroxyisobutyrate dehydrogenase-like beta-hydroxyacid dehydrogenase